MPRSKTVVPGRTRRKKILKAAKGNIGGRRKLYKSALQTVQRAGQFAYEHRRTRKRDFRRLWIVRINAAARIHDVSYSALMHGLKLAGVHLDRKILADLAVHDPQAFSRVVAAARQAASGA